MKNIKRGMLLIACILILCVGKAGAEELPGWSIYLYLCGSDLESVFGAATLDVQQLREIELPEGVRVIIEAGGTKKWHNHYFSPMHIERYIYDQNGFNRIDQLEQANMGDPETLDSFLEFCDENYSAEHEAVLIWNHGGGMKKGVCFDENYDMDSLTAAELREVFCENQADNIYSMIGFDACLMGSLESCFVLKKSAEYLVASEDVETGYGWTYNEWMKTLAENPKMSEKDLAQVICDSYRNYNALMGVGDRCSMTTVDLTRIDALQEDYEELGWEMLRQQMEDPDFFIDLQRHANTLYRFGENGDADQKFEYVDLVELIEPFVERLGKPADQFYEKLLSSCIYNVSGAYSGGHSISVYFPLEGNLDMLDVYENVIGCYSMAEFYRYCLTGELSSSACKYLGIEEGSKVVEERKLLADLLPDRFEVVREGDNGVVRLSQEVLDQVVNVSYVAMHLDDNMERGIYLGGDDELTCDWEKGEITTELMNWGIEFGGYLGYLNLTYQTKDFNLYDVPILLNDEPYYMHLIWTEEGQKFEILGVQKKLLDSQNLERTDIQLKPGDRIRMITKELTGDSDENSNGEVMSEEFIYEEGMDVSVREFTGRFAMMVILNDQYGDSVWSKILFYDL